MTPSRSNPFQWSYPLGSTVEYLDPGGSQTVSLAKVGAADVLVRGVVNGARRGHHVPVWTEREGREATTILVYIGHVLSVEPPPGRPR